MIKKRDIAVSIILSIVTCGIYSIIWFINLTDETKAAAKENNFSSGGIAFLLTLVTCGIYGIYWAYKMWEFIEKAKADRKMTPWSSTPILYLILSIFGLSIIVYALMQNDLNNMAE